MAGVIGTPVNDGYSAAATSHTATLPTGIQAGEALCIAVLLNENSKGVSASGFTATEFPFTVSSTSKLVLLHKEAAGDEGASVTLTITPSGTAACTRASFRLDGYDATDLLNSNAGVSFETADSATPSIAPDTLSITSGSGVLVLMSCEASRGNTAFDSDLDQRISTTQSTNSLHVFIDNEVIGTGTPQYDFTMSSNRAYSAAMLELKAGGPSITDITDPVTNSITLTTSAPVTATAMRVTAGGVTITQALDGGEQTGSSFAIASLSRGNLPALASAAETGAAAIVELLNGGTVVASTTTDLAATAGLIGVAVASPDTTSTNSVFNPAYCTGTPGDGDQLESDITINPDGTVDLLEDTDFQVRHWSLTVGQWGSIAYYTISDGVIRPRSPIGVSPVGRSPVGISPQGKAA